MLNITVGGKNTLADFKCVVEVVSDNPPEPKFYGVDVPGGNGTINLTTAIYGDTAYNNRKQEFRLTLIDPEDDFEVIKTKVKNYLHGREYDYSLSWDEGYTYHGWFKVKEHGRVGNFKYLSVEVDANPYKVKSKKTYKLNANGGEVYRFESGRKRVQPTFECSNPTTVGFKDKEFVIPQGTYKLPDVWFEEGWNEIYLNSMHVDATTWDEIGLGGSKAMTWDEIGKLRWFEVNKLGLPDDIIGMTWNDLEAYRWDELKAKTWQDITYTDAGGRGFTTYVSYDWSDL